MTERFQFLIGCFQFVGSAARVASNIPFLSRPLACGYVSDVALDYLLEVNHVNVTHELDIDTPSVTCFKRQVLVMEILLLLQCLECSLAHLDIGECSDFPEHFPPEFFTGVSEHLHKERVDV